MFVIMEEMRMHSDLDPAAVPDDGDVVATKDGLARRADGHGEGTSSLTSDTTTSDLGPLSPELALVDPGLAHAARALLPEPAPVARPAPVVPPPAAVPPAPAVPPPPARIVPELVPEATASSADARRPRRVRRLGWAAVAAGVGALALFLVLDREAPPETSAENPPAAENPAPATPESEPAPPTTTPAAPTPAPDRQTFVWAPASGAAAYEFQLFRGGSRIFRTRVTEPRLELPRRWRQGGRAHALEPGSYRWYVWPISAETQRQSRVATVQARLVIDD